MVIWWLIIAKNLQSVHFLFVCLLHCFGSMLTLHLYRLCVHFFTCINRTLYLPKLPVHFQSLDWEHLSSNSLKFRFDNLIKLNKLIMELLILFFNVYLYFLLFLSNESNNPAVHEVKNSVCYRELALAAVLILRLDWIGRIAQLLKS